MHRRVPKGTRELYKACVAAKGLSLNQMIVDFLNQELDKARGC